MLHAIIVSDPSIFSLIQKQTEARKVPLSHIPYEIYSHGNIRIIGGFTMSPEEILSSVKEELNPDTVFFLSESYPVSDEKLAGDIILPNVFFEYNPEISEADITKDMETSFLSDPIFLEHYILQGDYNFETFGLSVGGIHVSGEWNREIEDFRIRLRVVYENDTFDTALYPFVESAKKLSILEKAYPVAYIATEDRDATARNLWSIVGFIIGSIDTDLISEETSEKDTDEEEEEWVDGSSEVS